MRHRLSGPALLLAFAVVVSGCSSSANTQPSATPSMAPESAPPTVPADCPIASPIAGDASIHLVPVKPCEITQHRGGGTWLAVDVASGTSYVLESNRVFNAGQGTTLPCGLETAHWLDDETLRFGGSSNNSVCDARLDGTIVSQVSPVAFDAGAPMARISAARCAPRRRNRARR
jgi:hypothetical protein